MLLPEEHYWWEEEEDVSSKFLAELKEKLKDIPSFGDKRHQELHKAMTTSVSDMKNKIKNWKKKALHRHEKYK